MEGVGQPTPFFFQKSGAPMITDVTGILLAGGKSRRMGEDKRFLYVGERTLLERSCAALQTIFKEVCVVVAQDSPDLKLGVPVIRDIVPDCGSFGGLYTGLRQATTPHIFLAACDMPFLSGDLIRGMVGLKENMDIVIGQWKAHLQPTHAIYSRQCLPVMEEMISARQIQIHRLVTESTLRIRLLTERELGQFDPDGRSLVNVNTPLDLNIARTLDDGSTGLTS